MLLCTCILWSKLTFLIRERYSNDTFCLTSRKIFICIYEMKITSVSLNYKYLFQRKLQKIIKL